MNKFLFYNKVDTLLTQNIFVNLHNSHILEEIEKVRNKIDMCDDFQHREVLARKLARLRHKFIRGK